MIVGWFMQLSSCSYLFIWQAFSVSTDEEIVGGMQQLTSLLGPTLMEIKISVGSRANVGRPTRTTHENKADFQEFLCSGQP